MALDFDLFKVVDVKNPSKNCTEIFFSDGKDNELKRTSLVIFEQQVKYITTEEYETYKRVKIYIIDDDDAIMIDFHPDEYQFFEAFFLALYNKNI
ncbi:MAG: hypothetical protein NT085_03495 [candidate division SR1 bacterium]|nr:hypothetical protein [candidate division SR1 bacterium]